MNAAALYTPEWQAGRRGYQPYAVRVLGALVERYGAPASLLDVGCGEGALVAAAPRLGIPDAMGVDFSLTENDGTLRHADLLKPLALGRRFAWVVCLEVAEHLPDSAADVLCESIRCHVEPGGSVFFSAAVPGQGGSGHVNEQHPAYWIEALGRVGLRLNARETVETRGRLAPIVGPAWWYARNLMVLEAAA